MASMAKLLPLAVFVGGAAAYTCDSRGVRSFPAGSSANLVVSPLCLGAKIAGTPGVNFFMGPSPMSAVADKNTGGTIYFSWTEDLPITRNDKGMNGRIYVSKVTFTKSTSPAVVSTTSIDGFMRAGDVDITDAGVVGTLCAKHFPHLAVEFQQYMKWVELTKDKRPFNQAFPDFRQWPLYMTKYSTQPWDKYPEFDVWKEYLAWNASARDMYSVEEHAPLVLAVCFVDTKTMRQRDLPQRIGVVWNYRNYGSGGSMSNNHQANYPYYGYFTQQGGGYGSLRWTPAVGRNPARWVGWWGANWGIHTGYAMHVIRENADRETELEAIIHNVPESQIKSGAFKPTVISRVEVDNFGNGRVGTGDHQSGMMSRWHPGLQDIFHAKHRDSEEMYIQQFGLQGKDLMKGGFYTPRGGVHDNGRVPVTRGRQEGAMRPCGPEMIMAYVATNGVVCARFNNMGQFTTLRVLESNVLSTDWKGKHVRLATLGSREGQETTCGSNVKYLLGYWTAVNGQTRRWLTEINGNCDRTTTPVDVTSMTTWPFHQEWTTTAEGAVAWVTAWPKKEDGTPLFNAWGTKKKGPNDGHGFTPFEYTEFPPEAAGGSQMEAQLTVYWPSGGAAPSPAPGRELLAPAPWGRRPTAEELSNARAGRNAKRSKTENAKPKKKKLGLRRSQRSKNKKKSETGKAKPPKEDKDNKKSETETVKPSKEDRNKKKKKSKTKQKAKARKEKATKKAKTGDSTSQKKNPKANQGKKGRRSALLRRELP